MLRFRDGIHVEDLSSLCCGLKFKGGAYPCKMPLVSYLPRAPASELTMINVYTVVDSENKFYHAARKIARTWKINEDSAKDGKRVCWRRHLSR